MQRENSQPVISVLGPWERGSWSLVRAVASTACIIFKVHTVSCRDVVLQDHIHDDQQSSGREAFTQMGISWDRP
jgi:hypothetical protein